MHDARRFLPCGPALRVLQTPWTPARAPAAAVGGASCIQHLHVLRVNQTLVLHVCESLWCLFTHRAKRAPKPASGGDGEGASEGGAAAAAGGEGAAAEQRRPGAGASSSSDDSDAELVRTKADDDFIDDSDDDRVSGAVVHLCEKQQMGGSARMLASSDALRYAL
jgi:hypothetical protein